MPTETQKWQLRAPFFQGAKTYTIKRDGFADIVLNADHRGCFEHDPTDFPVGVYARPIFTKTHT